MSVIFSAPNEEILHGLMSPHPDRFLADYLIRPRPMMFFADHLFGLRQLDTDRHKLEEVTEALYRMRLRLPRGPTEISIGPGGITGVSGALDAQKDIVLLACSGLMRLRHVLLYKDLVPVKLSETSSGEQAVILGLLGISSQITENALVCIDEPEVCLHPAWQERYIDLLFHAFSMRRGCHFLIATHSPQIVAQIPDGNCYVMSMEDGIAKHAHDYSRRSIDFQLAEVFEAPGYRNEYLNRIALNVFAKVSKAKRFDDQSRQEINALRKSLSNLDRLDPLRDLIAALEEMVIAYG
ncbi:AAA family ATPase [Tahibacter soli]|uniref:AAA family ATPase n=1 Tax=Tahibacter soli TaxID=2983605 RepID=A0A9X3YL00_9GAMM|nr:AAA family ATPase [Tahibacter soli]MDC8012916.1 AAA family ATPase [Tahibacter soli]